MNKQWLVSHDVTRTTLALLFIGVLIAASFWVLSPFLIAIIWATMIVVATWPIMLAIQARLWGRRGLAVTVMTLMLLLIIIIPFSLVVITILDRAAEISKIANSLATLTLPEPPAWLGDIPLVGPKVAARWQQFAALGPRELSAYLEPYGRQAMGWFISHAGSLGIMIVQFLLTVIFAAILYAFGEQSAALVLSFFWRLAGEQGEKAAVLASKAIRGVALGVVVTAIMQATIGGIGLAVTGVPAAGLLTGVMFMLCLAQVGPVPVLIPAIIWLFMEYGAVSGSVLIVFTVLAATLDSFVRPVLIRKGADLPLILIFVGVIGGLIAFGVIGLFIGPVVLAVTFTLLKAWIADGERPDVVSSGEEQ